MDTANDFLIISPFNAIFNILAVFFALLLAASGLLLRGKSEKTKQTVLVAACAVTFVGYFVYKHFLSLDPEYDAATASMGGFNWWGELPIQLCNINMILIPIAVLRKSRPLIAFCFFLGPLGAMMALVMPGTGFDGYSLLLPRMLGYYGTHFMIVIEGLALAVFGLFRPRLRDMPRVMLTSVIITFIIFVIDMILRLSGLHPKANYFLAVETEGNFLLEIFYKLIPVPFLYLMPCIAILAVYMLIVTLPFELAAHIKKAADDSGEGE